MKKLKNDSLAKMILTCSYSTALSSHVDNFYCGDVNLWRDVFTKAQLDLLVGCREGESVSLESGRVLKEFDVKKRMTVRFDQWQPSDRSEAAPLPKLGRWYPQGYLVGVATIFPQILAPMRVVGQSEEMLEVDCNHPMAGKEVKVTAALEKIENRNKERGGRCSDWIDEALSEGPGMQVFMKNNTVDYRENRGYHRQLDGDDSSFYAQPRHVSHIDSQAQQHLAASLQNNLTDNIKVLDLMASIQSHLPMHYNAYGLGMNQEEMAANPNLSEWYVHDLNRKPKLPFGDKSFHMIMCHLSIEYLLHPYKVIADCARILKDNGTMFISFSNRWFPEKVTRIWQMLHEFERVGYVMDMLNESFSELQTVSYRNWPRPFDDPHILTQQLSDPVYIVTGRKKQLRSI